MLELYRAALRIRREHPALGEGDMSWASAPDDTVLHLRREPGFACVANLGATPVALPAHIAVLLTSAALDDGRLPVDAAAWLQVV